MSFSLSDCVTCYQFEEDDCCNFALLKKGDRQRYFQSGMNGACRECGAWIEPFEAPAFFHEVLIGHQQQVTVANSQRCEKCYHDWKEKAKPARGLAPTKVHHVERHLMYDIYYEESTHITEVQSYGH